MSPAVETQTPQPPQPSQPPAIVRRQRLIARLHELVHHRLLMVVAPAGYGKSTLLADFAADCAAANVALEVCRYAATTWDADGAGVLRGLAEAVRARYPGAGDRTLRLLREARAGTSPAEAERLTSSALAVFLGELRDHVPDYTLLVVDDYHLLDESPAARRTLEALLDRLPSHIHLALLSRAVPGLDTARLVLSGEVGALNPRDLAFDEEELALFLRQRYRIEPEPGLVEEVRRWTEGWITGLILAVPSLPGLAGETGAEASDTPSRRVAALVSTLAGARRGGVPLHEYLATHLLERLAPEHRQLLLAAALPEVCDPTQLDEVLGSTDSWTALGALERAGLPLSRDGDGADCYRLHALLQQFLRAYLERTDRPAAERLRRRWAEVAEAHQDPAAAVEHALAARWWAKAAALLEEHGEAWVDRGGTQFVQHALDALPMPEVERRPALILCGARLTLVQGRAALAIERARQALFAARRVKQPVVEARALLLEAMAMLGSGQTEEALQLCLQAIEHRTVRRHKPLLAEAYHSLGTAEGMRGLVEPALEHLGCALALREELGQRWDTAQVLNNLGVAYERAGQPERARRCHERALVLRNELGDASAIARSLVNLAVLEMYEGALDLAEGRLREGKQIAQETGQTELRVKIEVNLGELHWLQGKPGEALEAYRRAASSAPAASPVWKVYAALGEVLCHVALADPQAEAAARRALELASGSGSLDLKGRALAIAAGVALLSGRRREAGALLERAREAARETGSKPLQVRVFLWSGLVAHEQKRWGEALTCVQLAAEAAEALGGPGALAIEGPTVVPLLKFAASRGTKPELLTRALELLDRAEAAALREAVAPEPQPVLPRLQLKLLGEFAALVDGQQVTAGIPPRSKTREMLVYLVLQSGPARRAQIAADIWPEAEAGADLSLAHTTIHRLRQALFPELILSENTPDVTYRIDPAVSVTSDAQEFLQALQEADRAGLGPDARRDLLARTVAAYGGPFFPECYTEWAERLRRLFEQQHVTAVARLADLEWELGNYRACLTWCQRLLELGEADDAIHARMLECYERLKETLAGILHFRRYAREVAAEARPPAPRVTQVYRRLEDARGEAV